ncbi:MAG: NrtA/SsuA/CpmA family ABC transporter substrate-binding protein [Betaproteobacteria bacterium]|nr:NrtA/SsuA/CpmA family ABC transporter substrate-binding protein [Betaproteobacteria bacterium]MBV9360552.1 NrtA/SsuA/CpmA family ABC transporter substrate-binding protein [Betaproteobacteria bacterium]
MKRLVAIAVLALGVFAVSAQAEDKVVKVGALKLIHSITPYFYEKFTPAGYRIEVVPFESPTDGKNAVLTGSVDFGTFGIAAAMLGIAAGEPLVIFAAQCNRGMAVVAGANSDIKSLKDLKGKRLAIWPGSTQEVVILERLKAEGMTIKDVQNIRLPFSDMAPALARGDIDAYVGAEPGPGISLANGVGKIVEYPYSTPIGTLNMVWGVKADTIEKNPQLVRMMMEIHKKATEYAMTNRDAMVEMAMQKLGQQKKSIELAAPNVELTWKIDDDFIKRAKAYSQLMYDKKQIRELPNLDKSITTKFM